MKHIHDPAKITLPVHYPDSQVLREDFVHYYDEIAHLDLFFGEVVAELEKRDFASNTIVAIMGDNGCSQFRHQSHNERLPRCCLRRPSHRC